MSNFDTRKKLLRSVEKDRDSVALLYVTGDRRGLETKIGNDIIDLFVDHLDVVGPVPKISLILYTPGGNTSAAWNLVNLLHMFCDSLEVIVPGKCMSAGTLIALGADSIIMTKQATLGPIDPSIQHPLGPSIPGASPDARAPVSVEAVNGYLDAVRADVADPEFRCRALLELSNQVHPLVLGQIFRSRQQIRKLAETLLKRSVDKNKIEGLVDFLCSESGSHDYTINRREAKLLGLDVEKPSEAFYKTLRKLHDSYSEEMQLRTPLDLNSVAIAGQTTAYSYTRAAIESVKQGAHHFISEGEIVSTQIQAAGPVQPPAPQLAIQDNRNFEGWKKVA